MFYEALVFQYSCRQDYYNLMSVYLDSVFHPLLREQDFLQEGWRLENEEIEVGRCLSGVKLHFLQDPSSPLVIKGVVFNEMKGAYANPQSLFGQELLSNLCPSHTYGNSSGGYPASIPQLSWDGLKQFHAAHYHPSNCRWLVLASSGGRLVGQYSILELELVLNSANDSVNNSGCSLMDPSPWLTTWPRLTQNI